VRPLRSNRVESSCFGAPSHWSRQVPRFGPANTLILLGASRPKPSRWSRQARRFHPASTNRGVPPKRGDPVISSTQIPSRQRHQAYSPTALPLGGFGVKIVWQAGASRLLDFNARLIAAELSLATRGETLNPPPLTPSL
jgi:hypothetical protein